MGESINFYIDRPAQALLSKATPVKRQQFTQLVHHLEAYADAHPRLHRAKVVCFLILGYAYLIQILLLLVGLLGLLVGLVFSGHGQGGFVIVRLVIILLLPIYAILRALVIRLRPPEGIRLRLTDAPLLFAMIEKLRLSIRVPRLHQVMINRDFNAAVYQHPRLGLFGWHRNYLMIGYPMLLALDTMQFKAVLAHELGHISRAHSRLGNWIYRVRASWGRLIESFEKNLIRGASLFLWFFRWYLPHFHVWSLILARDHEYEADRVSASVVGADACARALWVTQIHGAFLNSRFGEEMTRRACEGQPFPDSYYGEMSQCMRKGYDPRDVEHWIDQGLSQVTDIHEKLSQGATCFCPLT